MERTNFENPADFYFLPEPIRHLLNEFDDDADGYQECQRIQKRMNLIGWDLDYDLSGEITEVWKMKLKNPN